MAQIAFDALDRSGPIIVDVPDDIYEMWRRGDMAPVYQYLQRNKLPPFSGGGNDDEDANSED